MGAVAIAFANQKGGVGKTTSVLNTGHALAAQGARVLLVDLDPQASLTICCGLRPEDLDCTVYNALVESGKTLDVRTLIQPVASLGCDLLPSSIDLARAEVELFTEFNREHALERTLRPVRRLYDYVLIDCPPSLGLLTINAFTCAKAVVVPIQADYLALRGADFLSVTIEKVREKLNAELAILAVIVTMYDKRTIHSREVADAIRVRFGSVVVDEMVPYSVRAKDAAIAGESMLTFEPNSAIAAAYQVLAERIRRGTQS